MCVCGASCARICSDQPKHRASAYSTSPHVAAATATTQGPRPRSSDISTSPNTSLTTSPHSYQQQLRPPPRRPTSSFTSAHSKIFPTISSSHHTGGPGHRRLLSDQPQVHAGLRGAAVAGAAGLDNRPLTAAAEAVLAMASALTGAVTDSEAHQATAARLIDDMTDEEIGLQLDALGYLVGAELYLEQFEATAPHASGIALAEAKMLPAVCRSRYRDLGGRAGRQVSRRARRSSGGPAQRQRPDAGLGAVQPLDLGADGRRVDTALATGQEASTWPPPSTTGSSPPTPGSRWLRP